MAMRTDHDMVKGVLLRDYDSRNNPSLVPFITGANVIINRLATYAVDNGITVSVSDLTVLETWVAAHLYTINNPRYMEKKTGDASAKFVTSTYLDGAMLLDPTGSLKTVISSSAASLDWLGLPPSEQTAYRDRD